MASRRPHPLPLHCLVRIRRGPYKDRIGVFLGYFDESSQTTDEDGYPPPDAVPYNAPVLLPDDSSVIVSSSFLVSPPFSPNPPAPNSRLRHTTRTTPGGVSPRLQIALRIALRPHAER